MLARRGVTLALSEGCGLLRQRLLSLFQAGVLNLHGSGPLPNYRGLGSLEFAIIDGKPVVMNLHLIDSGIDTGPIVAQQELSTAGASDLSTVYALLMRDSRDFIAESVRQVLDGRLHPVPQPAGAGRQYFEPHPAIAAVAERRLAARSAPRVIR